MIQIVDQKGFCLSYVSSGLFVTDEDWTHPKRCIDSNEVIYVVEGSVHIQTEDIQYDLTKGDVLLLYPGRLHFGYQISHGKTSFYWAHFVTSDFAAIPLAMQYLPSFDNYNFTGLFKQLLHITNTEGYPSYLPDAVMLLILNEIAIADKERVRQSGSMVSDVAEWVRINSDKRIDVSTVADHFGYNADYFSGLFKKSFGIGLKEYINNQKQKLAKDLLLSSNYSIKQIANLLGWSNENDFINYFKYHESISPARYKNTFYNTHFNKK